MALHPPTAVRRRRRAPVLTAALVGSLAVLAAACSSGSGSPASTSTTAPSTEGSATLGRIHHVFLIVLENEGYAATFGSPADDPYLAATLPGEGALLTNYYAIGHLSNDNYIALVSGQAPNPLNQADCQSFVDFPPTATVSADGQISDSGCVFPSSVPTLADQLDRAHLTWKGYMEDMGNDPSREAAVCAHPPVGAPDPTQRAVAGDGYATRHDPFVYFHSIIDDPTSCDHHVVPLG
ncbi:MAG: alkaline phosphatase family protein, partial [Acidimicrobiales bacterium]